MKQSFRNSINGTNGIVGQLATEKKKSILVVCLLILMIFMWIKVFVIKNPAAADAAVLLDQQEKEIYSDSEDKISYIELPVITGRNDQITRDIFASNGWKNFTNKNREVVVTTEFNVTPGDNTQEVIKKIADNIKMEALVMGENPKAYINDRILSIGDLFWVSDGIDNFECEVVLIENRSVVIRCGKAEVKLKMKQLIDNS